MHEYAHKTCSLYTMRIDVYSSYILLIINMLISVNVYAVINHFIFNTVHEI